MQLIHGDCRAQIVEADIMIVDPPYAPGVHKKARGCTSPAKGYVRKNDLGFDALSADLMQYICDVAANHISRWSVIFTDIESVGLWKDRLEDSGADYVRAIPWVRWSMPQLSGDRPPQGSEMVILGHAKGKKRWNGPGNLTHLSHLALRGEGKHRTEKPLDLMLDLVSWFSDAGETIYDPCMGSASTGLACKVLGRGFIGCELDAVWAAKSVDRLQLPFSKRDSERYNRWLAKQTLLAEDMTRMKAHTGKVRAKFLSAGADHPEAFAPTNSVALR